MPEELDQLLQLLEGRAKLTMGGRDYHQGRLWNHAVVLAFSRWGKVASAVTALELLREFGARSVIFTGVAGAIAPDVRIGDVVVGRTLYQHDMDARPIFARFEIPLAGYSGLTTDGNLREALLAAASEFLASDTPLLDAKTRATFRLGSPRALLGDIASGDRFVADAADARCLLEALPSVTCVEMAGAAVAQVCADYGVPFGIVRTISDNASEDAHVDFAAFVHDVAGSFSKGILQQFLQKHVAQTEA